MTDPVNTVAVALDEITDMMLRLRTQAVHHASSRLMPGGLAMVALGPGASPDEWLEYVSEDEFRHYARCPRTDHRGCRVSMHADDDDPDWEPPLQTLLYWSEAWRAELDTPNGRPTIGSEAAFLASVLHWAYEREPRWDDFAADVKACKARLENLLRDGDRPVLGVPCLYEECRGVRLRRNLVQTRRGGAWALTDWTCPRCGRTWDERTYSGMVSLAAELAKVETVDGEVWCSQDYAAVVVGRSVKTVRTWVDAGKVTQACMVRGRRRGFVLLSDVEQADAEAKRRNRERVA